MKVELLSPEHLVATCRVGEHVVPRPSEEAAVQERELTLNLGLALGGSLVLLAVVGLASGGDPMGWLCAALPLGAVVTVLVSWPRPPPQVPVCYRTVRIEVRGTRILVDGLEARLSVSSEALEIDGRRFLLAHGQDASELELLRSAVEQSNALRAEREGSKDNVPQELTSLRGRNPS